MHGHTEWVRALSFGAEANILASASEDGTVKIWDIYTNECLRTIDRNQGYTSWVPLVALSQNNQIVANGNKIAIQLHDPSSGDLITRLKERTTLVLSTLFHPNNQIFITCSWDNKIQFWDISAGNCMHTIDVDRPYEGTNITGVKGLSPTEIATLKALGAVENGE